MCILYEQMWGCGGTETRQAQMKQKNWERKDIEKHKQKKVTTPTLEIFFNKIERADFYTDEKLLRNFEPQSE